MSHALELIDHCPNIVGTAPMLDRVTLVRRLEWRPARAEITRLRQADRTEIHDPNAIDAAVEMLVGMTDEEGSRPSTA